MNEKGEENESIELKDYNCRTSDDLQRVGKKSRTEPEYCSTVANGKSCTTITAGKIAKALGVSVAELVGK